MSPSESIRVPRAWRRIFTDLLSRQWRLNATLRLIFPLAVLEKRPLMLLLVLSLGILYLAIVNLSYGGSPFSRSPGMPFKPGRAHIQLAYTGVRTEGQAYPAARNGRSIACATKSAGTAMIM